MKKILALLVFLLLICPTISLAESLKSEEYNPTPWEARFSLTKNAGGFALGWLAGFGFHEGCHQLAAQATDTHMNWVWMGGEPLWLINGNTSKTKTRIIASAGLSCQVISSEIILGIDKIPKDNSFVLGWLGFNIFNAISYSISNEIHSNGVGDLGILKNTGVKTEYVEAALIAHALLTAYRTWKNPDFPVFINVTKKDIVAGFRWEW